jgi:DNA (cytosine-5)-methyltransferase 1
MSKWADELDRPKAAFSPTFMDLRAGAGGFALGMVNAGFRPVQLVEEDADSRDTLTRNGLAPVVPVFDARARSHLSEAPDVLVGSLSSAGVSVAGKQGEYVAGREHQFALAAVEDLQPRAVLLVNVSSLMQRRFEPLRHHMAVSLSQMNYQHIWHSVDCADYGLPQARVRSLLLAFRPDSFATFSLPTGHGKRRSVGEALAAEMASQGWPGAPQWARLAMDPAPTIVGGSKQHGGADLGPTRTKKIWYSLGVDPRGIAETAPHADAPVRTMPRLTNTMLATLQGFPPQWQFSGRKTSVFRQIASAFPPPVAEKLAARILLALQSA